MSERPLEREQAANDDAKRPGIESLIAERDRLLDVTRGYASGEIPSSQVPPDAHTYYGRMEQLEAQIARETPAVDRRSDPFLASTYAGQFGEMLRATEAQLGADWHHARDYNARFGSAPAASVDTYFVGRADALNDLVNGLRERFPTLGTALPEPLNTDELKRQIDAALGQEASRALPTVSM